MRAKGRDRLIFATVAVVSSIGTDLEFGAWLFKISVEKQNAEIKLRLI